MTKCKSCVEKDRQISELRKRLDDSNILNSMATGKLNREIKQRDKWIEELRGSIRDSNKDQRHQFVSDLKEMMKHFCAGATVIVRISTFFKSGKVEEQWYYCPTNYPNISKHLKSKYCSKCDEISKLIKKYEGKG